MIANTQRALKYLASYEKLDGYGVGGKMISPEAQEFYADKNGHENILQWCVRKAIEALKEEDDE